MLAKHYKKPLRLNKGDLKHCHSRTPTTRNDIRDSWLFGSSDLLQHVLRPPYQIAYASPLNHLLANKRRRIRKSGSVSYQISYRRENHLTGCTFFRERKENRVVHERYALPFCHKRKSSSCNVKRTKTERSNNNECRYAPKQTRRTRKQKLKRKRPVRSPYRTMFDP